MPETIENQRRSTTKDSDRRLSFAEQLNSLRRLKRLFESRLGRLAKPIMFGMVGSTGMVVDLAVFSLLLSAMMPFAGARAIGIGTAMTWNYFLNRKVTFSVARTEPVLRQYLLFCASCGLGAALSWGTSTTLWTYFGESLRWPVIAAGIGILTGVVCNYLLSSRVVFRERK